MNFGTKIKRDRAVNGLTLEDVSKKLNLSVSYLSAIETGSRPPMLEYEQVQKLGDALGYDENGVLDLCYLILDDDNVKSVPKSICNVIFENEQKKGIIYGDAEKNELINELVKDTKEYVRSEEER